MSHLQGAFFWRLLSVAVVLLLLSLLAPASWYSNPPTPHHSALTGRTGTRWIDGQQLAADPPSPALPAPPRDADATSIEPNLVLASVHQPLMAGEAAPRRAPLGPLVADNIDLDPSITETPSLPARQEEFQGPSFSPASSSGDDQIGPIAEPPSAIRPEPPPEPELPPTKAWPLAMGLIQQLNVLAATVPAAATWAGTVRAEAEALARLPALADPNAALAIERLDRLADEGKQLALQLGDEQHRSQMLRAGYAVVRRVVIWQQAHQLALRKWEELAPGVERGAWEHALAEVDRKLVETGAAANWRKYLLMDAAREQFDSSSCSAGDQRQLARDMLHRLHSTQLSHDQEQFLRQAEFVELAAHLKNRAREMPDPVALLDAIERYEHEGNGEEARRLAAEYDRLRWSDDSSARQFAETVNAYYRNANVRVALSAELVNRMLPRSQQQHEPVQDTILGARVEGESHTSTKLRLVLVPDGQRWNIGLEALGEVASNTSSSKGPATFYQNGMSFFRARKRVTVDRRGIRLQNAEAAANANNNLDDFETEFDGIPLLSNLVRAIARNQYESSQPAAKEEVEGRIVWRATSQLDREVAQKLEKSKRDFQIKMIEPLRKLDLEPTAVDMETTAERLIGRYRVAGRDQVSAHTPRPQAPGDSLLSVQIHETALNNVAEHLKLNGRRIELRELYKEMTARFNPEPTAVPDDLPEDVYVTFADEDPVQIDCQDGRVRLQIRLKELSQEGTKNRWQNFTVRGYYAPVADQLDANLEREGIIELIGDRLRFGDQIALRGIFSRVLSRNRKLNLVNKQIAQAPELKDQQVTQFVIHDGWIGVALGPKTPGRTAVLQPRREVDTRTE